jgi:hypothetical protein
MVQWTISSDERPERKRRAKRCSLRQMRELEAARKVRCLLGFSCCVAGGAQADPRDDSLSAMLRGSAISDRTQRLICYDTAVARVPGALNNVAPPPAAAPTPFVASDVPPPPRQSCRAAGTPVSWAGCSERDTIDQISARLVSYQFADG